MEVALVDVELTRTYPISRHKGFELFMDVGGWAEWTVLRPAEPEKIVWKKKGDSFEYVYKSPIGGVSMPGTAVLDKIVPDEMVRMTLTTKGLPEMPVECEFAHSGPGAFTLVLKVHTKPAEGFWGDALQRILWIEGFVARDMKRCLEGFDLHVAKDRKVAA